MTLRSLVGEFASRTTMTAIARLAAIPYYQRKLRAFKSTLVRAHEIQREALFRKLHFCAQTRFGKNHGFAEIQTIKDFRARVPISNYEYAASYINDVAEGRTEALFPSTERVLAFACTTGTTGKPKLNPVTQTWLREYRRVWEIWGVNAIVEHPEMIGTKVLQLLGPGELGKTPSGLSIGMVSAVTAKFQNRVYRSFYATPPQIADIRDSTAKFYTTLRVAMALRVGFIVAITPSNLIRLAQAGNEFRDQLIRDIHDGTLSSHVEVPREIRQRIDAAIRVPRPARARFLEQVIERTGTLYPKDYWPLSLVSCWLGGTIGYQSRDLSRYYGSTPTRDLGLVSTEGRHTIPLHDGKAEGVLTIDSSYYEFVPMEERGTPTASVLECHELQPGREYSLVMTTSSGLYRYEIGDIVRCNGYVGQSPVLEFLHKDGQCADMEGEKVSGSQMASAVEVASRELSLPVDCFMAVPVRREGHKPYYALLIEKHAIEDATAGRQFLQIVDRELIRQNVMYAGKRNDSYIDSPRLLRLAPGSWTSYIATETSRHNTGDLQYKHAALAPDMSSLTRFQPLDEVCVGVGV